MSNYKNMCDIITKNKDLYDATTHMVTKNIENKFQPTEYDKNNESYYWELVPIIRIPTLKESTSRFAHLNAKAEIY